MFLPQEGNKTTAILILIALLALTMVLAFARFMPGTFTSLNRAFFNNHTLGGKKKGLEEMGAAATKTMRTRTGSKRAPARVMPGKLPAPPPER